MRDHIREKLCIGDNDKAGRLVHKCQKAVETLRRMFAWLGTRISIGELTHFQPAFILLLQYIIRKLRRYSSAGQNLEVCSANEVRLNGTLNKLSGTSKILKGRTDIAVIRGSEAESIKSWLFHVELKSPVDPDAIKYAKHQLLGQSEVIAQMKMMSEKKHRKKDGEVKDGEVQDGEVKDGGTNGDQVNDDLKDVDWEDGHLEDDDMMVDDLKEDNLRDGGTNGDQVNDDLKDGEVKIDQIADFRTPVLGCYTNLLKIVIIVRLPHEPWTCYSRVFYKTEGATEASDYTIRLLFLFCNFSLEELIQLTEKSNAKGVKEDNNADGASSREVTDVSSGATGQRDNNANVANNQRRNNPSSKRIRGNSTCLNDGRDEDDEIFRERLQWVNEWDSLRRGSKYLSKRNLDAAQNCEPESGSLFTLRHWFSKRHC